MAVAAAAAAAEVAAVVAAEVAAHLRFALTKRVEHRRALLGQTLSGGVAFAGPTRAAALAHPLVFKQEQGRRVVDAQRKFPLNYGEKFIF